MTLVVLFNLLKLPPISCQNPHMAVKWKVLKILGNFFCTMNFLECNYVKHSRKKNMYISMKYGRSLNEMYILWPFLYFCIKMGAILKNWMEFSIKFCKGPGAFSKFNLDIKLPPLTLHNGVDSFVNPFLTYIVVLVVMLLIFLGS